MTIAELRLQHPFPWRYVVAPNAEIVMSDSAGKQVPLFVILDFVCTVTGLTKPAQTL